MNLLIAGLDDEAKETIEKALSLLPDDRINQHIAAKVEGVTTGRAKRPQFKDVIG